MPRTIYVAGCEKHVPLRVYVAGIRKAKAHPDAMFPHTLCGWWPGTGAEIVGQFLCSIHDRINDAIPYMDRK